MPTAHKTTKQKGLGWDHRQQAAHLKSIHIPGTLCWWCGEPMYLEQGLHADHSKPRSQGGIIADRLLHGPCNTSRGDGHRDAERPAVTGRHTTHEVPDIGLLTMRWP